MMFASAHEAEQAFYQALARADLDSLMQVWSGDEEVVCVHPGGLRLVGHAAVRESWESILRHGALHIEISSVIEMPTLMGATHSVIEMVRAGGAKATEFAYCYATNVFHKGPTGWRLVMHHASAAPERAGVLDLHDSPGTLH